jgi:formylglycine-generating enzyme required for sulfatase activity
MTASAKCPECGFEIEPQWVACPGCGGKLPLTKPCPACAEPLDPSWKACPYCGAAATEDHDTPAAAVTDTLFRDMPSAPEMVVIPAGEFMMGSPEDEVERKEDEGPQHRVIIPAPFAMGRYAVTFDEFDHFVAATRYSHNPSAEGWGREDRPVINVCWRDAVAYANWLGEETGKDYRLPTEAEWEYACRAGTTTPFHFGETVGTDQANYKGNIAYGAGAAGIDRGKTVAVGGFPPNAFGLHEMHGNVSEWVADCYRDDAYRTHGEYPEMAGTMDESAHHVLRGGSWSSYPRLLRSANRNWFSYDFLVRFNSDGFRVARTLET